MRSKERLSASVDAELVAVAQEAVERGQADSVSAWVNEALRLKADHDRRLAALDDFLAAYETEHGVITEQEMHEAARRARAGAGVEVTPIDERLGRRAGLQLAASGQSDAIDASVVCLADDGDDILTSDPGDLRELAEAADVHVEIIPV